MEPETVHFRTKAFIFDLDGTLIDTIPLVERFWRQYALEHGLDGDKILETSHGVRTIETMARWTPHKATAEHAADFERRLADETDGISVLPGISALLQKIPVGKWGINTGGNEYMARKRLEQCSIDAPDVFVCGDMITNGKPDPEGYLTACERLGYKPEDVIVFEDAPAGVQGARRAGCTVIACETTHTRGELKEAGANCVVKLLADIDLTMVSDGSFDVTATEPL